MCNSGDMLTCMHLTCFAGKLQLFMKAAYNKCSSADQDVRCCDLHTGCTAQTVWCQRGRCPCVPLITLCSDLDFL